MAKPLRLLVLGVAVPMETFLERMLRGLAVKGMQITLASETRPPQDWLEATGIEWFPAPPWRGIGMESAARLLFHSFRVLLAARGDGRMLWRAAAAHDDWRARMANWYLLAPFAGRRWDVLYFPWNFAAVAYLPLFDLGMPVVLSCRGAQIHIAPHNPRRAHALPGLRETFEKAAAVHCVSQDILREAQALGLDPAKAQVIHPAVDADFFRPGGLPRPQDDLFRVVTTGSLIWRKGLEYALLTVRRLKDAGVPVRFEIIGDGPERDRVLFTVHDLDLQDCIHLWGRLSPDQVRARLQGADVFLLSSLSEGVSNAVLEAMACGLPVVTSECGGMREAVTDGIEGFVTPLRDPCAMAEKLMILARDAELRSRMGGAGRERVLSQFSVSRQIDSFTEFFYHLIRGDER